MNKSFAFLMFLMGILITAQTIGAKTPSPASNNAGVAQSKNRSALGPVAGTNGGKIDNDDNDDDNDDDDDEDFDEDEESEDENADESALPLLTCALFESDNACNTMCSMVGAIYGDPIKSGICADQNDCECDVPENASVEEYWNAKFDSNSILQYIRKNKDLSKKVLNVLKTPLQTLQKTIQDLKQLLPQKLLKRLRPRDNIAQNLISEDGTFDKEAVEKYVAHMLKSSAKTASPEDYKKTLINILNTAESNERDQIVHEIRYSRNKPLNNIIDEYFKKRSIKEPSLPSEHQDTLVEMLDRTIVNRTIRPLPRNNPNRGKVSLGAPTSRTKNTINSKTTTSKPKTSLAISNKPKTDSDDPWILPGFDKNEVDKVQSGRKCWISVDYYVCLTKAPEKTKLIWRNLKKNSQVEMEINKSTNEIKQDWKYNGNHVEIKNIPSQYNYVSEIWDFGNTKVETYKYPDGTTSKTWSADENKGAWREFQKFIESWCDNNEFFVDKESCSIYAD